MAIFVEKGEEGRAKNFPREVCVVRGSVGYCGQDKWFILAGAAAGPKWFPGCVSMCMGFLSPFNGRIKKM